MQVYLKLFKDIIFEGSAPASLDENWNVIDWEQPFYYLIDRYVYEITSDNKFVKNYKDVRDYTKYDFNFDFVDVKTKIGILEELNRREFEKAKKERIKIEERIKLFPNSLSLKKFPSEIEGYMNHSIEWFYTNDLIPPSFDGEIIEIKELVEWGGSPGQLQEFYKQLLENGYLIDNYRAIDFASHFRVDNKTTRSIFHKGKLNFECSQKEFAYLFYNLNKKFKLVNRWENISQNFLIHNTPIDPGVIRKSIGKSPNYSPPKTQSKLDKIITKVLGTN